MYAVERVDPPRELVLRIADERLPYGGTWTFRLSPAGDGGSDLAITEDGFIENLAFRTMARFVFGYEATMNGFLTDLEARGRSPFPQNRAVRGQRSLGQRPYRPLSPDGPIPWKRAPSPLLAPQRQQWLNCFSMNSPHTQRQVEIGPLCSGAASNSRTISAATSKSASSGIQTVGAVSVVTGASPRAPKI